MRDYLITLEVYIPYPVSKELMIQASNLHTAVSRAIKQMRKDHIKKGTRIDTINIKAEVLK